MIFDQAIGLLASVGFCSSISCLFMEMAPKKEEKVWAIQLEWGV
jgi:hypothetical protein